MASPFQHAQGPVLVFGKAGQLARAIVEAGGDDVVCLGRTETSIARPEDIQATIGRVRPAFVINAAAWTDVAGAEVRETEAMHVNGVAPGWMAQACANEDIPFVHISTDYVFDGAGGAPYDEKAAAAPVNAYGRTKLAGEQAVAMSGARHAILRTSWLFGPDGDNFVSAMLRLAARQDVIRVVSDQFGSPTLTSDLAAACLEVGARLADNSRLSDGVMHVANAGACSWAELAEAVMAASEQSGGASAHIAHIDSDAYPSTVQRPKDTRLDTRRFEMRMEATLKPWSAGLGEVVERLLQQGVQRT